MAIPTTPTDPISFEDLNDEIGVSPNQTLLDLETAGFSFSLDLDPVNWSDSTAGLGMDEFRGGGVVATFANITYVNPSTYAWQALPVGTPVPTSTQGQFLQPGTVYNPSGNPASLITAGPHSFTFGVEADGSYVVVNSFSQPSQPISPSSGTSGSAPDNLHTIALPALPYAYDSAPNIPSTPASPGNTPSSLYTGFFFLQDRLATPTTPATVLENGFIRRLYNDKSLTHTANPIPYQSGTHTVGYIDWRFGFTLGDFGISTSAPANPLSPSAPWITGTGRGTPNEPSTANFRRTPITVTVTANPSPSSTRTSTVFAFLPSAYNGHPTYTEMNRNGSPGNPTNYYYPITVTQGTNPVSAPTMTITPDPIPLDFSGDPTPVTLNVNPNTKSYSVSIVGPEAPNFSFSPTPSPKTGDANITVGADPYTGASPRTATLRTIIPAPNPSDVVTTDATIEQTGISLRAGGYYAPVTTPTDPAPYLGQPATTWNITTTAPSDAPWTTSTTVPWITIPATTSGTGPSPFNYTVAANPTYSSRTGDVVVDFDVDGTPYQVIRPIDQDATPATPEFSITPNEIQLTFNGANPLQTKQVSIDTNVPFTVAFTGDTSYWSRNSTPTTPASETSFTVPFGAPSPYVFEYTTPTVNDDYEYRNADFTVTSPVSPGTYTVPFRMNRNPSYAYLTFQHPNFPSGTPAFDGMFTLVPYVSTNPVLIAKQGGTGKVWVTAHPNLTWSLSVTTPAPGIPGIPLPVSPTFTPGTGPTPNGVTYTIPASTPTSEQSILWTLSDSAPDAFISTTKIGIQPPGPIPTPTAPTPTAPTPTVPTPTVPTPTVPTPNVPTPTPTVPTPTVPTPTVPTPTVPTPTVPTPTVPTPTVPTPTVPTPNVLGPAPIGGGKGQQ